MTKFRTRTSMDGFVWSITIGFFVLGIVADSVAHSAWILPFFVVVGVVSFALNPMWYSVDEATLRIHRPIGAIAVPLASIQRAERLVRLPYIRVFGIGGLFGYYGLYWSKATGVVKMYGRNRRNPILLVLRDGSQIVLMPDDLDILNFLPS